MKNEISKVIQDIDVGQIWQLEDVVKDFLKNIGNIYSYIIYVNYKGDEIEGWSIQYNISQIDKFNTLCLSDIVTKICTYIQDDYLNFQKLNVKYVIGYEQPSLELILKIFNPLVKSLAKKQHDRWQQLEYNDLCQDCRLVICMLYQKGYYIHKRLVEKSFNNLVLMSVKKDKYKPAIISLDDVFNQLSGETELTIKDVISDVKLLDKQQDEEDAEVQQNIFDELKELVIDEIGERGFEQLLKSYGTKTTDDWSRYTVRKLKAKFQKNGVYELLKNKYN